MSIPYAAPSGGPPGDGPEGAAALVVTRDRAVVDVLERLAAAAGVGVDVRAVLPTRAAWSAAGLVLVGPDLAADLAGAVAGTLPRRPGVVLVSNGGGDVQDASDGRLWQLAVDVGAERVAVLPDDQEWVVQALVEALEGAGRGPVVAVVGGSGGAGASVLAAAIAVTAAGRGQRTLLADLDPLGGGVDLLVGAESVPGLRWPELGRVRGRISGAMVRAALPRVDGLSVLSWGRGEHLPVPPEAAGSLAGAAVRAFDLVVADLGRSRESMPDGWLSRVDLGLVVVPRRVRAVAAAACVVASLTDLVDDLRLVLRGPGPSGLPADLVAESLGLPFLAELRPEPGLEGALERGEPPGLRRRGPLARCARQVLEIAAQVDRAA